MDIEIRREIEQKIIGSILIDSSRIRRASFLVDNDFYFDSHKKIWKAILTLSKRGDPVDMITIFSETMKWPGEITSEYLDAIKTGFMPFQLIEINNLAKTLRRMAVEEKIAGGIPIDRELLSTLAEGTEKDELISINEAVEKEIKGLSENTHLQDLGVKTGFPILDSQIGGLKNTDLVVIAGRTSMGKSTFAFDLAIRTTNKQRGLYINLEMSSQQLAKKLISNKANLSGEIFFRQLTSEELRKAFLFVEKARREPYGLDILDRGRITVDEIRGVLAANEYKILFIDQLTKIKSDIRRDRPDLEIAEITIGLKAIAKDFNIPVILIHQINREAEHGADKKPQLSNLKGASAIEEDADVVLLLFRNGYYTGDPKDNSALIKIAKNKMGRTGEIGYKFLKEYHRFEEDLV